MGTLSKVRDRPSIALSVTIPCYNEAEGINELYRQVTQVCQEHVGQSYEIVLVNDGSTDSTRDLMFRLANADRHIIAVDLARNYGHQIALSAALEFCRGQRVLVIDADLQDPPELLGAMMAKMDEGYDVVYGVREERAGESAFKKVTASAFYRLLRKLSNVEMALDAGDFRLMNRRTVDHLVAMPERHRFIRGMVSWIGLKQVGLPYKRRARFAGETHYPLRKMIRLALDATTSFSIVPLQLTSLIGFTFGLLGFGLLAHILIAWSLGWVIQGWTSLIAIILILGSVQLIVLGIFGEYLGRMYMEGKRRPLFIVNEIVANNMADTRSDPRRQGNRERAADSVSHG